MITSQAIRARRSTKVFDPNFVIPDDHIHEMLSLAALAPTAFNIQHWRFVVVKDEELRAQIRAATWMQPQITDASVLVVLCADTRAWEKQPERYWRNAPQENREGILAVIEEYYGGNPALQRDEAMRSCAIAAQTLMLSATEMGYDTCPMDLSDFEEVAKVIKLPEDHIIAMYVAIGKGLEAPWPRGGQLDLDEVVLTNTF